jgi:hypothetical protein
MDEILPCDVQGSAYICGRRNQIIMFKSCFPNNGFRAKGAAFGEGNGKAAQALVPFLNQAIRRADLSGSPAPHFF